VWHFTFISSRLCKASGGPGMVAGSCFSHFSCTRTPLTRTHLNSSSWKSWCLGLEGCCDLGWTLCCYHRLRRGGSQKRQNTSTFQVFDAFSCGVLPERVSRCFTFRLVAMRVASTQFVHDRHGGGGRGLRRRARAGAARGRMGHTCAWEPCDHERSKARRFNC
jgi:hypothetical protein